MTEPQAKDLLKAITDTLHKDGRLGRFKGELRAAVISILNKPEEEKETPQVPEETKLIDELVREYLHWNGYIYAEQILVAESFQDKQPSTRQNLATKLGVVDDSRTAKIPLLYYIVSAFHNHEQA